MSVLGWIFFGLTTGFIASKIVSNQGQGCLLNIALGLVGALVGGALFAALGDQVFWQFDFKSTFVAIIGAVVVLVIYHALTGRRPLR